MPRLLLTIFLALTANTLLAHPDGPDPILAYDFNREAIQTDTLKPRFGPPLKLAAPPLDEPAGKPGLRFSNSPSALLAQADPETLAKSLPTREFTIAAWFSIDSAQNYGALFSSHEDNGNAETGLVLGYDNSRPILSLATTGTDDGDGRMVTLRGEKPWKTGQIHQLVATYDGTTTILYLDGEVAATSAEATGDIQWPADPRRIAIGGYLDRDENFPHNGRLISLRLFNTCATQQWVTHDLEHGEELRRFPIDEPPPVVPAIVVQPYLQWITTTEATIRWETNFPCIGQVRWGLSHKTDTLIDETEPRTHHEIKLTGLEPEMLYYYQTLSTASGEKVLPSHQGTLLETPVSTLQTANNPNTPFAFVVLSDVQTGGSVPESIANAAWELRPNFTVIAGDLVDNGNVKSQWTDEFFKPLKPLIERVPFYPVLGNHDLDSRHFYEYMSLPNPEYFYTFSFGNTQFFMLDTNRDVRPGTEQYQWLDRELAASTATWKVCVHHQPPFSSDDDYGNDWKRPIRQASLGDEKSKPLVALYDQYNVDLVWSGHIHSYERTWQIRNGQTVEKNGTLYMITGGSGGPLERHGPFRPGFQRTIKRGHHFCYVAVNGGQFEIQAYDLDGRLFDHVKLSKEQPPAPAQPPAPPEP
jgi:3',5'-cyclic AMP phosphodiesterase CpdA